MDEIFGVMDGRFRSSIIDSTMMWIVHYAMDRAHEKVKSKEGVIGRLNEISKFYELAVLQLEGCMKCVQEETDSYILESNRRDVLADLTEIRDRLQGRLKESELAISDKDRELTERLENELKLRQELELQERELVSLRANLELEKTKSEGVEEFILSNRVSIDEDRDGEFCELKNSVDQQVFNIKQKLEPDSKLVDEGRLQSIHSIKVDQMGSDIDVLKQTLDLAFGKMQNAIFLSQLGPIEQQWRRTIEKDAIAILIKDFMKDFQENFEAEMKKQEKKISVGLSEQLSDLMKEISCLRNELESLSNQNEVQVKNTKDSESLASVPKTDLRTRGKSLSEGDSYEISNTSFNVKNDKDEDGHYVAKMIKNHESIIRRKSEELNWLQREFLQEKGYSSFRREKEPVSLKRRIQEVIARLDNFINWNAKLGEIFNDYRGVGEEDISSAEKEFKFDVTDEKRSGIDSLEDVWKRVNGNPVSNAANEELHNEIKMLKQVKEDADLQTTIMEDIYFTAFKGLINEFYNELYTRDFESLIREGMYKGIFEDLVNEWNENIESNKIEAKTREEIYYTVLIEAMNDFGSTHDFVVVDCPDSGSDCPKDSTATNELLGSLEGTLRENVCTVFFQEMYKEWNESIESYNAENVVREEISRIVFDETMRDIVNTANDTLGKLQEVKVPENFIYDLPFGNKLFESEENSLKMNSVKEACTIFGEAEAQNQYEYKISEELLSAHKLHSSRKSSGVEILIQTIETLLKCFDVEEDLMLRASSEIKEHNVHLDLVGSELEELDENKIFQELLTGEKNNSSSVNNKLEKALQQLVMSKTVLSELGSSLGIAVGDLERVDDQMTHKEGIVDEGEPSIHQATDNEELKLNPSDSIISPVVGFSQVLVNFERTTYKKLQMNILRLEKMKSHLDLLVDLVASLRERESIYQKAFVRRSQNLRKAEIEVDLLGDQVDVLLGLLEKIYMTLHHHSPALQQYFEVSEILKLIKTELREGVHASK